MLRLSTRHVPSLGLLSAILFASSALAQTADGKVATGSTRAELVAQARMADSVGRKAEAFLIQRRLRDGDFEVGDRIVFSFQLPNAANVPAGALNLPAASDTLFVVQAGKILQLPEPLGMLNVNGMLRSEIRDSLAARVALNFKNAVVRVSPLLRVSITGFVRSPGPYYVRADMPLGDFIQRTGGIDPNADLNRTIIRRGEEVLWRPEDVQPALSDGLTLDQLSLEPGDEVVIAPRKGSNLGLALQIAGGIATAVIVQLLIRR